MRTSAAPPPPTPSPRSSGSAPQGLFVDLANLIVVSWTSAGRSHSMSSRRVRASTREAANMQNAYAAFLKEQRTEF